MVVIKEFRVPIGGYEYGFPAGLIDSDAEEADVTLTVKRELKEETGLKVSKILLMSPPVVSSAGLSDEAVRLVFVECTGVPDTAGNDRTEDITVEVLDLEGVAALRRSGAVVGAKMYPILLMFEAMKKIAIPKHLFDAAS